MVSIPGVCVGGGLLGWWGWSLKVIERLNVGPSWQDWRFTSCSSELVMYSDAVLNLVHLYVIPPLCGLRGALPFWCGLHDVNVKNTGW